MARVTAMPWLAAINLKCDAGHADARECMLIQPNRGFGRLRPAPAMSNTERQRRFRERNPGYYQRLHAKRRAEVQALGERRRAIALMLAKPVPLMLPAPVETIEIPGMTTIGTIGEASRSREANEVSVRG